MRNVEAMTETAMSPTLQTTCQTTESQYPLHSPDISKTLKNTLDDDLTVVITAWPQLPDSMRKGIVAMAQAASLQSTSVASVNRSRDKPPVQL